jgi:hypothetical protein
MIERVAQAHRCVLVDLPVHIKFSDDPAQIAATVPGCPRCGYGDDAALPRLVRQRTWTMTPLSLA